MSINIFIWGIALMSHAACKSFGALFACRFILGVCEGAITPGYVKAVCYWMNLTLHLLQIHARDVHVLHPQ
jgi:MFS family permease